MNSDLKLGGFWYLATPYTHHTLSVRAKRAWKANECIALLLQQGYICFSPIWTCHHLAIKHELPTNHEYWIAYNKVWIDASIGVIVAKLPGWQDSKGIRQEINYALQTIKPIFYFDGDKVTL